MAANNASSESVWNKSINVTIDLVNKAMRSLRIARLSIINMEPTGLGRLLSGFALGLVLALAPSSRVQAAADFQFRMPDQTVEVGETVLVPIYALNWDTIGNFQFDVNWNAELLTYNSTTIGIPELQPPSGGAGTLTFLYTDPTPPATWPAETPIATIQFTATTEGITPLTFSDVLVGRSGQPVTYTLDNGSITVVPEPINVALGTFAGLVLCVGAVRKCRNRKSA